MSTLNSVLTANETKNFHKIPGQNCMLLIASPFGWYRISVLSPVLMSHKITLPSTEALATTKPFEKNLTLKVVGEI